LTGENCNDEASPSLIESSKEDLTSDMAAWFSTITDVPCRIASLSRGDVPGGSNPLPFGHCVV
jgi:hypothetical protein